MPSGKRICGSSFPRTEKPVESQGVERIEGSGPEENDRGAEASPFRGRIEEFRDAGVGREKVPDFGASHPYPFSMNESHLVVAGRVRLPQVLFDCRSDILGTKRMKVEGVLDRNGFQDPRL